MCIKNGILRVLFSGRSFIDFQGGALRAPPPGRTDLSQTSGLRGLNLFGFQNFLEPNIFKTQNLYKKNQLLTLNFLTCT